MVTRASVSNGLLKRFRSKGDKFLVRLVTVEETWARYYEAGNKAQCCAWEGPGSLVPKQIKKQSSADKVMVTVFWEAKGAIQ